MSTNIQYNINKLDKTIYSATDDRAVLYHVHEIRESNRARRYRDRRKKAVQHMIRITWNFTEHKQIEEQTKKHRRKYLSSR